MGHQKIKRRGLIALFFSLAAIIALSLYFFINSPKENTLSIDEAQQLLDATLEETLWSAEETNFLLEKLKQSVSIDVNNVQISEAGYLVDCTVTSIDAANAIMEYLRSSNLDQEYSYEMVLSGLEDAVTNAELVSEDFVIELVPNGDGYDVLFSNDLIDFASGSVENLIYEIQTLQ